MNTQNVKTILNLFMREQLKVLKLEANVNGMKVNNQLNFSLILKKTIHENVNKKTRSKWKTNL